MTPYRGPLTRSPLSLEIININRVGKTEALFDEEAGFASSRVNVITYTPRWKNKRKNYRRVILNERERVENEEEGGSRPKNRSNFQ